MTWLRTSVWFQHPRLITAGTYVKAIRWKERTMETEDKCSTCDGTGAVAVEVNGVKGIDSCPACDGDRTRKQPANDQRKDDDDGKGKRDQDGTTRASRVARAATGRGVGAKGRDMGATGKAGTRTELQVRAASESQTVRLTALAPLAPEPPTENLSACIAACVASSYGEVRPRQVDPDEVTVVARLGGAR